MPVAQPARASDAAVTAEAATSERDESLTVERSNTGASKGQRNDQNRFQSRRAADTNFQCEHYTCQTTVVKGNFEISLHFDTKTVLVHVALNVEDCGL
jgi:hypothetical protein